MDSVSLVEIKENLNSISISILEMLSANESLTYTEIKDRLRIGQNKVTKELARLEGALLITSKKSEIDGREIKLSLSKYGHKILKL